MKMGDPFFFKSICFVCEGRVRILSSSSMLCGIVSRWKKGFIELEKFGNLISPDGATAGHRYWLRNVVFQNGNNVVADHQNAPNPFDFLFDTGTTLTIVNNRAANSLGLSSGSGTFNCFGGTSNGYVIDSVTMIGSDGSYRINNANICWQESAIESPQIVDAVIGSNFFDQVQIIFDGPGDTLGIKQWLSIYKEWWCLILHLVGL